MKRNAPGAGRGEGLGPTRLSTKRNAPGPRQPGMRRSVLNLLNGTTPAGIALALLTGAKLRKGRDGLLIAEGYARRVPPATCFTVGSVILTRRSAAWLLHPDRAGLLAHEARHADQCTVLGPLTLPAYWLACGWSWALTGDYGARNAFERHAGLAGGGYRELPLRGGIRAVRGLLATGSTSRGDGSPAPR